MTPPVKAAKAAPQPRQPTREPVAVINSVVALVEAVVGLAVGLGLHLREGGDGYDYGRRRRCRQFSEDLVGAKPGHACGRPSQC